MKKFSVLIIALLLFSFLNVSCSVYQTIVNISRLKFKLGNVNGFSLNGVNISAKSRIEDFTAADILKISSAVAQGNLPVSFILNIEAKNPNDGTGGYKQTNATLQSFPWRLLIDDKQTVSGNISSPVTVPGTGDVVNIPIQIGLDLMQFFKDQNYRTLMNLALNIGGSGGSSSKLTMYAKPTVSTSLGNISYPQELKIINMEFTQ